MRELAVSIEIEGVQHFVGTITGDDSTDASFCYDRDYLVNGVPVSVSLPLREEVRHSRARTARFPLQ